MFVAKKIEGEALDTPLANKEVAAVDRIRKDSATTKIVWFDTKAAYAHSEKPIPIIERVFRTTIHGAVLYPDNYKEIASQCPTRISRVLSLDEDESWKKVSQLISSKLDVKDKIYITTISSSNCEILNNAHKKGFTTCYRTKVNDANSLQQSYEVGKYYDFVMIGFKHTTNIPLELVVAKLHDRGTKVLKETTDNDDALIALGVLEIGADGVVISPADNRQVDALLKHLTEVAMGRIDLQVGTITKTEHLGMGYRSCIDTTTLFSSTEGILLGSTSGGGILCCPEVFHLPYMDLRPFRVNAGAVHSYVFNVNNQTNYISELKAGSKIMVIDKSGKTRTVDVGRIKTEIRPLLLIETMFKDGTCVNVIMQDDWHVRIFSDAGLPLNVSDLKPGDKILGYTTDPGRHVGVKIDEYILER